MDNDKVLSHEYKSTEGAEAAKAEVPAETAAFTIGRLFLTWIKIGFTSFGGGTITQYLIQEYFIFKHKWITEEEYANYIAMGQLSPGMNIFAYTILIGKKLAGWRGIFFSLVGLILPSAAITVGISVIYATMGKLPKVSSGLKTAFAAIFGISLATNWRNTKPILAKNRKRGMLAFSVVLGIITGSAALYVFVNPPVIVLYLLGGLCGAAVYWYSSRKKQEE